MSLRLSDLSTPIEFRAGRRPRWLAPFTASAFIAASFSIIPSDLRLSLSFPAGTCLVHVESQEGFLTPALPLFPRAVEVVHVVKTAASRAVKTRNSVGSDLTWSMLSLPGD